MFVCMYNRMREYINNHDELVTHFAHNFQKPNSNWCCDRLHNHLIE